MVKIQEIVTYQPKGQGSNPPKKGAKPKRKSKNGGSPQMALVVSGPAAPRASRTQVKSAPLMKSVTRFGMDARYPGSKLGGMRIQRREFIGTILGQNPSLTLSPNSYPVNPGQQLTFLG